jgi:hypothetical protein
MAAFSLIPMHSKGSSMQTGGGGVEHHCEGGGVRWEVCVWTKKGTDDMELLKQRKAGLLTYGPPIAKKHENTR